MWSVHRSNGIELVEAGQLIPVCPTCGTAHETIGDRDALITKLTRENTNLRGRLRELKEGRPKEQGNLLAWELWEFYRAELGVQSSAVFDAARQQLAEERLADIPIERLKEAFRGLKLKPYRGLDGGPIGRFAEERPGTKRDVRFELVLRNAMTVDQFAGYVEEAEAERERRWEQEKQQAAKDIQHLAMHFNGPNLSDPSIAAEFGGSFPALLHRLQEIGCKVVDHPHNRASAQCPAHEDRDPSLSIRECDDGKVLIHCFAGCRPEAVLEKLGLAWGDLFGFDGEAANWGRR
jgi:hypothetical protein